MAVTVVAVLFVSNFMVMVDAAFTGASSMSSFKLPVAVTDQAHSGFLGIRTCFHHRYPQQSSNRSHSSSSSSSSSLSMILGNDGGILGVGAPEVVSL